MDIHLDTPGGLKRELRVKIPAEKVSEALETRLRGLAKQAKLPGFRPGKAPINVIRQQYGESARMDVINDLVRGSWPDAVGQAGVDPVGTPSFEVQAEQPGQPLEYIARFEVYPEIKLQGLDKLKIEQPEVEITDADIARVVESMRQANRELPDVDRPAKAGDACLVDFEGAIDGTPFNGGKGKDADIEIGSGRFLPDLEHGLEGHSAGEQFEIPVRFPEDYGNEDLRGKAAVFRIDLKKVREPKLPDVDDAFLQKNGVEPAAGVAGLHDKVTRALGAERDKAIRNRMRTQALEQLLVANPVDVPDSMLVQEKARLRNEAAARFNAPKMDPAKLAEMFPDELMDPTARRRVSLGLLIGEVIRLRALKPDAARIEQALDGIAADYQQPEQVKQHYRSNPQLLQGLQAMAMEEQVVENLIAGVTLKPVKMTFDQLVSEQKGT